MTRPTLLTIEEAAETVGVSKSLLHKLTAKASISSVRLGARRLYDPDTLLREMLERGRRDQIVDDPRKRARRVRA